jgi:hypothetical protein
LSSARRWACGFLFINSGATGFSAVVSGGTLSVASGGRESGATLSSNGALSVASGGIVVSTIVRSVGLGGVGTGLDLLGGTASSTVISSGGREGILSGGIDIAATITLSGTQLIQLGGSYDQQRRHTGHRIRRQRERTAETTRPLTVPFAGGAVVSGAAVVVANGIVDVLSGGTANIAFLSNGSGGLEIADTSGSSNVFSGTVSGFGGVNHANHKQFIDLVAVTSDLTVSRSIRPPVRTAAC